VNPLHFTIAVLAGLFFGALLKALLFSKDSHDPRG